jgi:hypothetical protein
MLPRKSGEVFTIGTFPAPEMETQLTLLWDHSPAIPMKAINTRHRNEAEIRKMIADHFGNATADRLKILPGDATESKCPCMVLRGSQATDAIHFIKLKRKIIRS